MLHRVVFKDGMELLEFAQGDGVGSLAYYVQDFSHMLIVAPMKEKFVRKLVFMHGLNPWVCKIVYQKLDILDTNVKAYDDGGVHGGWRPSMPQGWIQEWGHLEITC